MTSIALLPDASTVARSPSAPTEPPEPAPPAADELRAARNRRNAQRSTGPRTPEGKRRSAQNATAHGLCALTPPPDLARDPDFQQAKAELWDEYRPATPTQVCLVNQLAHLTWKLDQIPRLEHQILATPLEEPAPATPVGWAPPTAPSSADPTTQLMALHLLQNQPTPLTRLWDLHRRLLARTQSLIRQLLQLQTHHQKRLEQDAADEAALAQSERADRANAADRAARDQMIRDFHATQAAKTRQGAPDGSKPHTPTAPAQNEPTSAAPSVTPWCTPPSPAQPGATPRNKVPHSDPPAQNEPTVNHGQWTMDNRPLSL